MIAEALDLIDNGQLREAERLLTRKKKDSDTCVVLSRIYAIEGRDVDSRRMIRSALKKDPNSPMALNFYAENCVQEGKFELAEKAIQKALRHSEDKLGSYISLSGFKRAESIDDYFFKGLLDEYDENMPMYRKITTAFSIAKCYNDIGEYGNAFEFYEIANRSKRRPYNPRSHQEYIDKIKSIFTDKYTDISGNDSKRPIFIVGMPRSGTTLTEQILSSHPAITAGGEIREMTNIANGINYPKDLHNLDFERLGADYLKKVNIKGRFTDKLPNNYHFLGLIRLAFPNCKIIHVKRNPVANCFSCYQQNFDRDIRYAYDFEDLAQYYLSKSGK